MLLRVAHLLFILSSLKLSDSTPLSRKVSRDGCYVELDELPEDAVVVTSRHMKRQEVPEEFNWGQQVDLSPTTNQLLPSPCGSCWAHAAVGALTDRIIIARRKAGDHTPVVPLSPQVLLDCQDANLGSCHGGSALGAYAFIYKHGITDITCAPYAGVDNMYWGEVPSCSDMMCRNCDRFGKCEFVDSPKQFVKSYGVLSGEEAMKAEIYNNGPIACSVYAHSSSFDDYKGGVIEDSTVYNSTTHVVAVTGWGVTPDGTNFWWGRNSFGTTWGLKGWFQLHRGNNTLDVETHTCAWAIPELN